MVAVLRFALCLYACRCRKSLAKTIRTSYYSFTRAAKNTEKYISTHTHTHTHTQTTRQKETTMMSPSLAVFSQVKNMPLGADVEFCSSYDPDHTEIDDSNLHCDLRCKKGFRSVSPRNMIIWCSIIVRACGRLSPCCLLCARCDGVTLVRN